MPKRRVGLGSGLPRITWFKKILLFLQEIGIALLMKGEKSIWLQWMVTALCLLKSEQDQKVLSIVDIFL